MPTGKFQQNDMFGNAMNSIKNKFLPAKPTAADTTGDVYISPSLKDQGIFKAYMPRFLYKPPFGYPRSDNVYMQRQLARNPYIYSITKTVVDEVAHADWDIKFREESERKEDEGLEKVRNEIKAHLRNPNQNKESWGDLRKQWATDVLEVDAGVHVKVFNHKGEYSQLFVRDGGSFLVNPDIYGYMGNRADYVEPLEFSYQWGNVSDLTPELAKNYSFQYGNQAAYFQYGTAISASVPVPFGKREIIYSMMNPRSDQPYGRSPVAILADIILTLVYGANFNLDYYMNNNMPEGVLVMLGANADEIKRTRARLEQTFRTTDENTGFSRRIGYRFPITASDAKFVPFQIDPQAMQIIEQQKWFYVVALACYGVPPDSMGVTENSNKAVSESQTKMYLRKSARPLMDTLKYKVDNEIIAEWGKDATENLEYVWVDYDVDLEMKKRTLSQMEIQMGIKTPEMVAEELGIDYSKVTAFEDKQKEDAIDTHNELNGENPKKPDEPKGVAKEGAKSAPESKLEEHLAEKLVAEQEKILDALSGVQV